MLAVIRELLIRRGAVEDRDLSNPHEAWRVRIDRVVFTGYRSGTIYCNGGNRGDPRTRRESVGGVRLMTDDRKIQPS